MMKKIIIKKYIFACLCLIFLTTQTSTHELKRIIYPSFVNSAQAGAIVGVLAPTTRGSLFVLTLLTSSLYNIIPLVLGLINVIITLKKERHRIVGFNGYYPTTIYPMNFNNLINITAIASTSFLVTIFTYYTSFDIANSLTRTCIALYKKLTAFC